MPRQHCARLGGTGHTSCAAGAHLSRVVRAGEHCKRIESGLQVVTEALALAARVVQQGPGTDQRAVAEIRAALNEGQECTVRLVNYTKSGKPFWNMFTLAPVRDHNSDIWFYIGVQVRARSRSRCYLYILVLARCLSERRSRPSAPRRSHAPAQPPADASRLPAPLQSRALAAQQRQPEHTCKVYHQTHPCSGALL